MKKKLITGTWLFVMWILTVIIGGCGSQIDNALISIEEWQTQIMEIWEKMMNGEISTEKWELLIEEITEKMESVGSALKDNYSNVSDFDGIPKWAKDLGAYELKWFDIVVSDSSVTKYSKKDYLPESMSLVYTYDDEDEAIQVAEKLATNMNIKESGHSPRLLQAQLEETMKSMLWYMSDEDKAEYEKNKISGYIADESKWDYYIMVSVLDGEISIIINNDAQMGEFVK